MDVSPSDSKSNIDSIHMNGRAYDYNLGRFLSVDPFIGDPGNSQAMNPYSYIMNNPLAGTDPSGYLVYCDSNPSCDPTWLDTGGGTDNGNSSDESGSITIDNGAETNNSSQGEDSSKPVEETGSLPTDVVSNQFDRRNGGYGEMSVTPKLGGTKKQGDLAHNVNKASFVSGILGEVAGIVGSAKHIPQFTPTGSIASWSTTWGSVGNRAFVKYSFMENAASKLRVASKFLGGAGVVLSFANNASNPDLSGTEVGAKVVVDTGITALAIYGGVPGIVVAGMYLYVDYQVTQQYKGGWTEFGQVIKRDYNQGVYEMNQEFRYLNERPNEAMHDLFNVPYIRDGGRR